MANLMRSIIKFLFLIEILFYCKTIGNQRVITDLCSSTSLLTDKNNENKSKTVTKTCDCIDESSSPWGFRILQIDCSYHDITFEQFQAEMLPINADTLDLSWNKFDKIPRFSGKNLKRLKFSHNRLTKIFEKEFIGIRNLRELDLSWSSVEMISLNAFEELRYLQRLDLSHNNLRKIQLNTFSPLVALEDLNLSWNTNLNESSDLKELDFFSAFSVTTQLKTLRLGHCNLNNVILNHGVKLQQLYLEWNNLTIVSDLPKNLKLLDLSGNPIEKLESKSLPHLFYLETLILDDMPNLKSVNDYSLFGIPTLHILSFQNSKKLSKFHPHTFGVILNETDINLQSLNFRGTAIKSLNSTLYSAFDNLKSLDLSGTPLLCDCDLYWMVGKLQIETNGRCSEPSRLRGWKLSKVSKRQFNCSTTPQWLSNFLNGLLIILLIVLCIGGIFLIVLGLRPKKMKERKIGATSPYAPITVTLTIEPNRAE